MPGAPARPPGALLVALLDDDGAAIASGLAARIAAEATALDAELLVLASPGGLRDERALASLLRERPAGPRLSVAETMPGLAGVAARNVALDVARAGGRDVLLLPPGTCPRPGTIAEMVAVATLDPMIGFVAARTNDGDAATSPYHEAARSDPAAARAAHEVIERRLPRFTFAPTLPAAGLLIRHAMLAEFGLFDEAYRDGPIEQHDLIRRCNRCGYRAVLANHAYVERVAAPVDLAPHARNGALLNERYPEHHRANLNHTGGAEYRAQAQMSGFLPDPRGRLRVLFDCRILGTAHSGTFEHMTVLLGAFARVAGDRYAVTVLADEAAFRFHGLDRVAGLHRYGEAAGDGALPFAVAFRIGQPFIREDVLALADLAPVTGFLMLDTIALDCQYVSQSDLAAVWRFMADTADVIAYNSETSLAQFRRRFPDVGAAQDVVSRCSTDVADYAAGDGAGGRGGVLLVGNPYAHKHVAPTLAALRAQSPTAAVAVLGVDRGGNDDVARHALGDLSQAEVSARYRDADVVLYPSHYEGFGLPILHALAAGTPVVARDIPSAREVAAHTPFAANIHLAGDTQALAALAADPPPWDGTRVVPARPPGTWEDAARALAGAFDRAVAGFDYHRCVTRQARFATTRDTLAAERRAAATDEALVAAEDARATASRTAAEAERARARLAVLAGYGVAGDFALGDAAPVVSAARVLRQPRRAGASAWLSPPPRRRDAGLGDPPFAAPRAELRLKARLDAGHPQFAALLLGWARAVTVGGRLVLVGPAGADPRPRERALRAAGFCPTRVARRWGRCEIEATKLVDWAAPLPGPADDALFLVVAYRRALGRDPDPAGEAHYRAALAAGASRAEVLAAIMATDERARLIEAAISPGGRES